MKTVSPNTKIHLRFFRENKYLYREGIYIFAESIIIDLHLKWIEEIFKLPGFIDFIISKHVLLMEKALGFFARISCKNVMMNSWAKYYFSICLERTVCRVYIHTIR